MYRINNYMLIYTYIYIYVLEYYNLFYNNYSNNLKINSINIFSRFTLTKLAILSYSNYLKMKRLNNENMLIYKITVL